MKTKLINGLSQVYSKYDAFLIDLWGVIHNGIRLHNNAIKTLIEISNAEKNYVLLTNAPRPNNAVKIFTGSILHKSINTITIRWLSTNKSP